MIVIFIIYFIFLVWLFEFSDIEDQHDYNINSDESITIIIDYIHDLNGLFSTIDNIKLQKYNLNNLHLIILDSSSDDINILIDNYKYIFASIDVFKVTDINQSDLLNKIKSVSNEYILFIESGITMSQSLIPLIMKYMLRSNLSAISLPLFYRYKNHYHKFYQLFHCFIESVRCSLINKNFNLSMKNFIIHKEYFIDFINQKKMDISTRYFISPDLCLYKNEDYSLVIDRNLKIIHISYSIINFLFIFTLLEFITSPNQYFFILLIIKIIPELSFIYTFYNRLRIKFPKIDYLIFCVIGPFYSVIELIYNQVIINNNKS
tara:strand:+ start:44 stop:1000 length:957 start_codon:yes stop_codon:yes gene_type:complete